MALGRADIWPVGDVALATAVKHLKGLDVRPTQVELADIAKTWAPYRATAARMLWNYYLNKRWTQPRLLARTAPVPTL